MPRSSDRPFLGIAGYLRRVEEQHRKGRRAPEVPEEPPVPPSPYGADQVAARWREEEEQAGPWPGQAEEYQASPADQQERWRAYQDQAEIGTRLIRSQPEPAVDPGSPTPRTLLDRLAETEAPAPAAGNGWGDGYEQTETGTRLIEPAAWPAQAPTGWPAPEPERAWVIAPSAPLAGAATAAEADTWGNAARAAAGAAVPPPASPLRRVLAAGGLFALYLLVCVAPLGFMFIGHTPKRPFLIELSGSLGFVGLSLIGLQFVLVTRFRAVSGAIGIDTLHVFHKHMSFVALGFILLHPALLWLWNPVAYLPLLFSPALPLWPKLGAAAVLLLLAMIGLSIFRRQLKVPYELWQLTHGVMAVMVVTLAVVHILGSGYVLGPIKQGLLVLMAIALVSVAVWGRIIVPLVALRQPWRVAHVQYERAKATTVTLEPAGHSGFTFRPGQFAWISHWPLAIAQHPFSLSSPDEGQGNQVTITVKALGDWTRSARRLRPGRRVYVDGPYGDFTIDHHQAPGYVFVAGGVGITPIYSMVRAMEVREDGRPVILFYANRDWESVIFREQLEELERRMPNLKIVHILQDAPAGWAGERGRISAVLLIRHLPQRYRWYDHFICGPPGMMNAAEDILKRLGVPDDRIHVERFSMV